MPGPSQQNQGGNHGGSGGSGGTILYVGDSIGVGMQPYIEDLVDIREYDALGGRPSPPGVAIVKQKLNSSDSAVVFDLGTNDGLVEVTEDSLKEVIDFCSKQNVILGLVPPGSQDASKKNDLMRKLSQDNEGVIYVDTGGLPLSDGIHPTPDGAKQRARLFAEALGDLGEPVDRGGGSTTGGTVTSGAGTEDLFAAGRAAAFSTQFEVPGLTDSFANLFSGDKSIYNDQPLLPFIEQLCGASFRHFQSLPDGTFFAFFPDYFGAYGHRKPYWQIDDIEIIDGQIELNDDELATHVFVAGDTNPDGNVDFAEMANSKGVITIFDAFNADPIVPEGEKPPKTKDDEEKPESKQFARMNARVNALDFLTRYGQRPYFESATFLRNPYFEVFYAYLTFQLMWSKQFLTTFTLTFMPELYPGGIVAFEKYGFQAYIESVDHTFDYESGFTTQANLMAPSALDPTSKTPFSNGLIKPGPPLRDQTSGGGSKLEGGE